MKSNSVSQSFMMIKRKDELVRALTLKDAVGVGLGAIIGAGIFVVTGVAAGVVAIGVVGAQGMAASTSPLQVVANALSTPAISIVVTIGASTAMLGVLLSQILGISRMMLAMGRRNDLASFFKKVDSNYMVPHFGIVFTGLLILLLTITGSFEFFVRAASFTILLYYSITNIAALKQPRNQQRFGRVVPLLGLIGCLVMSFSLPLNVILIGFALLFVGFLLRFLLKKTEKNPSN